MKHVVLLVAFVVMLSSCKEDRIQEAKKSCAEIQKLAYPGKEEAICNCFVDKLIDIFPNGDQTTDQTNALMNECAKQFVGSTEDEFRKRIEEEVRLLQNPDTLKSGADPAKHE